MKGYKIYIDDIKEKVVHTHTQYQNMLDKLSVGGYTATYIQEWDEKERLKYDSSLMAGIDAIFEKMGKELKDLKESARIHTGDKEVSANNILKLQAILPGMSLSDKEKLFESAGDKDPNILEILYFNVKNQEPLLASKIMEKMDSYTGNRQISIVEKEYEQLSGLRGFLTFDAVKNMGSGFSDIEGGTMTIEGTVDRILEAYRQEIEKKIEEIKKIEA